jgi:acid phosphatase
MSLWQPTRRELIKSAPLALAAAALPTPIKAAASNPALRFSVVGDWGRDGKEHQSEVANAMHAVQRTEGSEFVVSTGDNFYGTLLFGQGVETISDRQWDTSFERIYSPDLGPWYVTLGNHDYAGNVEAQIKKTWHSSRWRMPNYFHEKLFQRPSLPSIHLFFIDTVAWIGSETRPWSFLGSAPNEKRRIAQMEWLINGLRGSPAPLKLVFGHHGIYSIGKHGGEMRMKELDDVLRRFDVTAYVNGHDHCMYHVSHQGMHYICSGAGSEMLARYKGGFAIGPNNNSQAGCVLPGYCEGTHDPRPVFPVWHSFGAKDPGGPYELKGGFAHFTLTAQEFSVKFYEGIPSLDAGDDRLPRVHHPAVLRRFAPAL